MGELGGGGAPASYLLQASHLSLGASILSPSPPEVAGAGVGRGGVKPRNAPAPEAKRQVPVQVQCGREGEEGTPISWIRPAAELITVIAGPYPLSESSLNRIYRLRGRAEGGGCHEFEPSLLRWKGILGTLFLYPS